MGEIPWEHFPHCWFLCEEKSHVFSAQGVSSVELWWFLCCELKQEVNSWDSEMHRCIIFALVSRVVIGSHNDCRVLIHLINQWWLHLRWLNFNLYESNLMNEKKNQLHLALWVIINVKSLVYFDGSMQDCSSSIASTLELLQSCTKPSI